MWNQVSCELPGEGVPWGVPWLVREAGKASLQKWNWTQLKEGQGGGNGGGERADILGGGRSVCTAPWAGSSVPRNYWVGVRRRQVEDGRRAQAAGTLKRPFSYILHYTHLNLRAKLKKHRGKHSDLGLDSVSLGITSKSQTAKEKLDKLYFIRIKYFHTSKDTIWKAKGEPSELEGIFVNHIPEKGLVSIICEGILPPNKSKKQLKMVKESEHTFLQRCPSGQ